MLLGIGVDNSSRPMNIARTQIDTIFACNWWICNANIVDVIKSYGEKRFAPLYFFLRCDFRENDPNVKRGLKAIADMAKDYSFLSVTSCCPKRVDLSKCLTLKTKALRFL
jgi:hypothetical protein